MAISSSVSCGVVFFVSLCFIRVRDSEFIHTFCERANKRERRKLTDVFATIVAVLQKFQHFCPSSSRALNAKPRYLLTEAFGEPRALARTTLSPHFDCRCRRFKPAPFFFCLCFFRSRYMPNRRAYRLASLQAKRASIAFDAVSRFRRFDREAVVLSSNCSFPDSAASLSWDPVTARYAFTPGDAVVAEPAIEAAASPEK
jgi:hypothetical protein